MQIIAIKRVLLGTPYEHLIPFSLILNLSFFFLCMKKVPLCWWGTKKALFWNPFFWVMELTCNYHKKSLQCTMTSSFCPFCPTSLNQIGQIITCHDISSNVIMLNEGALYLWRKGGKTQKKWRISPKRKNDQSWNSMISHEMSWSIVVSENCFQCVISYIDLLHQCILFFHSSV